MRALSIFAWIYVCLHVAHGSNPQVWFETNTHKTQAPLIGRPFKGGLKHSHDISGSLFVPPMKGCAQTAIKPNRSLPTAPNGRVFLVQRGYCKFYDKAKTAEMHGAIAMIIYNSNASHLGEGLSTLFGFPCNETNKVSIPTLMLSHDDGMQLLDALGSGHSVVNISAFGSPQCNFSVFGYSYAWAVAVAIGCTCAVLCVLCILLLVIPWFRRHGAESLRNDQPTNRASAAFRRPTLTNEQVNDLETVVWRTGRESGDQVSCSICLDNFVDEQSLMVMPCLGRHMFHATCIQNWLLNHSTKCPLCKYDIASNEDNDKSHAEIELSVVTPNVNETDNETLLLHLNTYLLP